MRDKLLLIKELVKTRETVGYPADSIDFKYELVTMEDERVCPICNGLAGLPVSGAFITTQFHHAYQYSASEWMVQVHGDTCRCILRLTNGIEACAEMLRLELLELL